MADDPRDDAPPNLERAVEQALDQAIQDGYVEAHVREDDGEVVYKLTPAGEQLADEIEREEQD